MKYLKCFIVSLAVMSISACSWFSGKSCDSGLDPTCDTTGTTNTYQLQPRWYCQGHIATRDWSCSHDAFAAGKPVGQFARVAATHSFKLETPPLSAKKAKTAASFSVSASASAASQAKQVFAQPASKTSTGAAAGQLPAGSTELPSTSTSTSTLAMSETEATSAPIEENEIADIFQTDTSETQRPLSGDATYDRFNDLPSDNFAIQLLASKTLKAIKELAARVDLSNPTILKIELFANPLFVLILDTFNSYQLAQETKQAWTEKHGNLVDPWIRTVGSLQESMLPIGSSN
jgi:septal ring-binding cell division protein DamX